MATALDLIKSAMKKIGVYSIGEDPSADEAEDGLNSLNSMLDSWANENLFVFAKTMDSIPIPASTTSITIGPTGSYVTDRPVKIDASTYFQLQGVSYPIVLWGELEYNQITVKSTGGIPAGIFPLMTYPDIELTFWPVPSDPMTLVLWSNKLIRSFPDLVTDLDLPPGYQRAIEFSLAEEIAPDYEVEPPQTVVRKAAQARKNLKRTNTQVPLMRMPYGIPNNNGYVDWQSL